MHDFWFCRQLPNPSACPPNDLSDQMLTSMANGINIYSFFFQISKKLFWICEKEFVISEILAH